MCVRRCVRDRRNLCQFHIYERKSYSSRLGRRGEYVTHTDDNRERGGKKL